ncbi:thiamine phosphate phosphatase-like protein [Magnolia sinica]|uniref:thiamine phosphate phosphatase-like protein n=1 Tax=Magnolia sinica TaxID=86752 RepID=UPI002658977A|nr:thiamine phosphate phosphatase-like protein [Magnolia sinica]
MAGIVVVFDFDKTIIDCDSDNWVVDGMGATNIFNELLPILPWNSLMDRMMKEIHSLGKTIEDIEDCLKRVPLHPHIITAIKSAYALGCDLRIVSDANVFFIETILKQHGLFDYFSEINTNPIFIDEDGKFRILPYQDCASSPHGCNLCPPNMCKGLIVKRIQASVCTDQKKRLIYIGDGKGDFCPSTKLGEGDHVMPRKNFPLWDLISSNPMLVKAKLHEWSNAEELGRILLHLINTISIEDNNSAQMLSIDCKFQTIPISSHEALPPILPIPH